MIIDFHTHCYPDRIAERAVAGLCATGGITAYTDGTLSGLSSLMSSQGVGRFVVNNIATDERRMRSVNDFAISMNAANVIAFGSVPPFAADAESELVRLKESGIRGIKFHPYFQDFYVDDPLLAPVYRKASELGFIILFHAGSDISFKDTERADPDHFLRAFEMLDISRTPVVLAHWGGSMQTEAVLHKLCGLPVYFDTAFGAGNITADDANEIISLHGDDRILFGSDCPWSTPARELAFIDSLGLTDESRDKILRRNAEKILYSDLRVES